MIGSGSWMADAKKIEYMCSWCGKREIRFAIMGRPSPGSCSRKTKTRDGKMRPHTWVVSRRF